MRVSANKDTAAVARMVQKWRKPTNPISQGRLGSYVEPKRQPYEDMSHQALHMEANAKPAPTSRSLNSFCIGIPHADTGVREIRELIGSGKAFAVLTSISLIPQIARGTNEKEFDEAVAEKVDGMTKLIMASTADAWLIHLPGMIRKHEAFTAEQLIQDMESLDDLTYSMEDHNQDISQDGCEPHPLSFCLFSVPKLCSTSAKRLDFPSLLYRKLKKKAKSRELHSRPLLVQTRAQGGSLSSVVRSPAHKRKLKAHATEKEVVVGKQRQSPLSSWIGKQLVGQKVSNKYLDKDGHLITNDGGVPTRTFGHPLRRLLRTKNCRSGG
jgi:hypothetical protein